MDSIEEIVDANIDEESNYKFPKKIASEIFYNYIG